MKRVAFKTLGCRLNHYETDSLATQFSLENYEIVDFDEVADIYIINSCTVTQQSNQKVQTQIKRAHRCNHKAMKVVMGCMANSEKEALEQRDDVDCVIGNEKKSYTYAIVDSLVKNEMFDLDSVSENRFNYKIANPLFHTRSLVKIQDGCDNFCSFCIIPKVRGRAVSRPVEDVLKNVSDLVASGYKEVVITGVNIGRYEYNEDNFESLLVKILNLSGDFRVRISSLEPDGFGDRFYELFRHPKLTPHLHLCLQSGSPKILEKMRRMYSLETFAKTVSDLRSINPLFNITTDIIVGFPSETDDDFEATLSVMKEMLFGHVHTFKYSVRKQTKAANMEAQIPEIQKTVRSQKVRELAEILQVSYRKQFVGKTLKVLTERVGDKYATGYSEYFVPVKIVAQNLQQNKLYEVKITEVLNDSNHTLSAILT